MNNIRILHISDSHMNHQTFDVSRFKDIDLIIHSGDCSNSKVPYINENEVRDFIEWYKKIPIKYKIYVAGNHDGSIERKLVTKMDFKIADIIYLEHEFVEIEGLRIFGSPYTPTFHDWFFMKARDKTFKLWDNVPIDKPIDIFICHGPPKGILDTSLDSNNNMEFCGDESLRKIILNKIKPKLMCFGHIHDCDGVSNAGIRLIQGYDTIFSNGACVRDGRFNLGIVNHGNIFTYNGSTITF